MTDQEQRDDGSRIDGLEARELLRAALGDGADPEAEAREVERERDVRSKIETHLPELKLLELLGRGGMGYVYRARQTKLERDVALKVIAPEGHGQRGFAERFAREAQALARLSHPNIVSVYDYGQEGDFGWLVMEYVEGSNLGDVIRGGKLEPGEALALIPQICDALQYAHDQGVVHRDVKPQNLLLDRAGGLKIADFGLAKLIGSPAALVTLTGSQQVLGTFRYMAPEQLDAPLEVDHRADIYALGVVFYEMLTGEIPMGRFDPPSERSTASIQVDDVVLRALQKEPDRRYQRASEVKADVESIDGSGEGNGDEGAQAGQRKDGRRPAGRSANAGRTLSVRAAVSSALAAAGCLPMFIAVVGVLGALRARVGGHLVPGDRLSFATILSTSTGLVAVGLWTAAALTGFRALRELRRDWPARYGVGAATFGAWAGPLLLATVVLSVGMAVADQSFRIAILLLPVWLCCDAAFLIWYRARALATCRSQRP